MSKTCSEKCQHLLAEKTRQSLRDSGNYAPMASGYQIAGRNFEDRICDGCGDSYTPTMPRQRLCGKKVVVICRFCEEDFQPRRPCDSVQQIFCSLICGNLSKGNSKVPIDKLNEFKAIDDWALNFFEIEGRKPNHVDARIYFGVRVPGRANLNLFSTEASRPFFEDIVLAEISKAIPVEIEVLREKQPLRGAENRRYELDLWIPELNLAFEVQDFSTHSRDYEDEPCSAKFPGTKKGPSYHLLKQKLAREQLNVELVEIWEDEIMDGSFQTVVRAAIAKAHSKISPLW